jgi:hypothetical protein
MATATQQARPRRRRLQFSLRLLLVAMFAFAVGFPIWYRWPYVEEEVQGTPPRTLTRTTTWQRKWGGGRLKHGTETRVTQRYQWITTYSRGIEDGPYKELLDGEVIVSGQYRDGQRDGLWKHVGPNEPIRTANYRNGRLHGWYEITDPQRGVGRATRLRFVGGRLIERDGQPIASRLFDLYQSGKIDDSRLAKELMRAHGCAFDASLRDA